ncbi:mannose-6-phosphate isomerase-like protein (cupin superfamily) [Streptomyces afghaniensis]|nr:mannose-6-phosphate isomerase-like protein (cupin superfamily) [Streptomyces afghaniensis]
MGPSGAIRGNCSPSARTSFSPSTSAHSRTASSAARAHSHPPPGQHHQPRPGVLRMRPPLGVSLAHRLVDELTGGLLGHPEVSGQVGDRRTVRGEPGEGEAVCGAHPLETAGDHALMDASREPAGGGEGLCAWRGEIPAGLKAPARTVSREEIFHLLDGELLIILHDRTERITAGDTLIINPGATLTVENPTDRTAYSWATTSIGLEARLADGTRIVPPWAD